MPDYSHIARLAAELDMSLSEIEEMIASEAADLARHERTNGNATTAKAKAYDEISARQWAEAAVGRARTTR